MPAPVVMAEVWRGAFLESQHLGHAVIVDAAGEVIRAWGDPDEVILPRSSAKMIQALPLVESGAADAAGLTAEHLSLACASHSAADIHIDGISAWLGSIKRRDDDLRCGPQMPRNRIVAHKLIRAGNPPCQIHNNCSGKHTGFLTLARHLGAGLEYIGADHPVQIGVREAFEDVTAMPSPGYAIDGCSAPNFATTLTGLARAMAFFASADDGTVRGAAARRLVNAMVEFPELIAGKTRTCTELMRAMGVRVAIKTGAEAVYVAILPDQKLGVALKIADGAPRASECAIAAILVRLGVLAVEHPATLRRMNAPILNRRGISVGEIRPGKELSAS
jgi:L-asparaginase II